MFCKKCGSSIRDGAGFCPKCGQRVENPVSGAAVSHDFRSVAPGVNLENSLIQKGSGMSAGQKKILLAAGGAVHGFFYL